MPSQIPIVAFLLTISAAIPAQNLFVDDVHPAFGGHRAVMWAVMRELGTAILGDVNGDSFVNTADLVSMWSVYGPCTASSPADLEGDLCVDSADRLLLLGMLREN